MNYIDFRYFCSMNKSTTITPKYEFVRQEKIMLFLYVYSDL